MKAYLKADFVHCGGYHDDIDSVVYDETLTYVEDESHDADHAAHVTAALLLGHETYDGADVDDGHDDDADDNGDEVNDTMLIMLMSALKCNGGLRC